MKKTTLQFVSLPELAIFSKALQGGYLLNTVNYTITASIPQIQVALAQEMYHARPVETGEKVFSYELLY